MVTHYIGADVDSRMTDLAVERKQRIVREYRVPTTIPALRSVLAEIPGRKLLVIEEGPSADWLYRNLRTAVDEMIVCDPRRNRLITADGDKDNPIDARKLAELLRGGHLRAVHHSDSRDRVVLKEWVSLYHDRVGQGVREVNKIRARLRMYGQWAPRGVLSKPAVRQEWLAEMPERALAGQLELLFMGRDTAAEQVARAKRQLGRLSRQYEIVGRWQELPGVGLIRALTLLAYLDTPWRFRRDKPLWKYCGVGLLRFASGTDRRGRPKPGKLRLPWAVNRRLKDAVMGAAITAIYAGNNVFSAYYQERIQKGLTPGNARRSVARKLLSVMWAMWKTGSRFDPRCV
jgi:transposase